MKRIVEMAICYSDGTWRAKFFVEVDDPGECCDSPGCCGAQDEAERLEKLGQEGLQRQLAAWSASHPDAAPGPDIVSMWLYHYGDEEEDETETPQRSQVTCVLSFDMDMITEGSEAEQQDRVIKVVNFGLRSRAPALGASLEKTI